MTASEKQPISICVVASGDWASFSRVNCHEIATRWTAFGRVCYEAARAAGQVEVVSPAFLPWSPVAPVRAWNVRAAARAVRRRTDEHQWPFHFDVLWFFSVSLAGLEAKIPHKLVIYHAVDDYAANPGVDPELLRRREAELLGRADLAFTVSEPLAERLRPRHRRVVLWENVSDTEPLLEAVQGRSNTKRQGDPPTAAFVGNLSAHKVDFVLLLEVVRGMTDWRFVLAGPLGDLGDAGRRVLKESNVRYVGPVHRTDLPRLFADADVGLLPIPPSGLHESSFPIKVFDYLALGLPIVGRRSQPLQGLNDLILPAESVEEYARAMSAAIALRRDDRFLTRARRVSLENSWGPRIDALARTIRQELARRAPTTCGAPGAIPVASRP